MTTHSLGEILQMPSGRMAEISDIPRAKQPYYKIAYVMEISGGKYRRIKLDEASFTAEAWAYMFRGKQ